MLPRQKLFCSPQIPRISSFQPKSCKVKFLGLAAKKNTRDSNEHNTLAQGPSKHLTPLAYTFESNSPAKIRQIAEHYSFKQLHCNLDKNRGREREREL
jgi:hypothetical protein